MNLNEDAAGWRELAEDWGGSSGWILWIQNDVNGAVKDVCDEGRITTSGDSHKADAAQKANLNHIQSHSASANGDYGKTQQLILCI